MTKGQLLETPLVACTCAFQHAASFVCLFVAPTIPQTQHHNLQQHTTHHVCKDPEGDRTPEVQVRRPNHKLFTLSPHLTRLPRIEEGDYYEAHQQIRTIANRYVRSQDYPSAVDLLGTGAGMLLKAGQGGSGSDLCVYLMEVYNKAEMKPDVANKARLVSLLRSFPENEPGKKKFVGGITE
jgi:hypothetical protein